MDVHTQVSLAAVTDAPSVAQRVVERENIKTFALLAGLRSETMRPRAASATRKVK